MPPKPQSSDLGTWAHNPNLSQTIWMRSLKDNPNSSCTLISKCRNKGTWAWFTLAIDNLALAFIYNHEKAEFISRFLQQFLPLSPPFRRWNPVTKLRGRNFLCYKHTPKEKYWICMHLCVCTGMCVHVLQVFVSVKMCCFYFCSGLHCFMIFCQIKQLLHNIFLCFHWFIYWFQYSYLFSYFLIIFLSFLFFISPFFFLVLYVSSIFLLLFLHKNIITHAYFSLSYPTLLLYLSFPGLGK